MKRFKNGLHGLYADLGKRKSLNTDFQTNTLAFKNSVAKLFFFFLLFLIPFFISAKTTFNNSGGKLSHTTAYSTSKLSVKVANIFINKYITVPSTINNNNVAMMDRA